MMDGDSDITAPKSQIGEELRPHMRASDAPDTLRVPVILWALGGLNLVVGVAILLTGEAGAITVGAESAFLGLILVGLGFWAKSDAFPAVLAAAIMYLGEKLSMLAMAPEWTLREVAFSGLMLLGIGYALHLAWQPLRQKGQPPALRNGLAVGSGLLLLAVVCAMSVKGWSGQEAPPSVDEVADEAPSEGSKKTKAGKADAKLAGAVKSEATTATNTATAKGESKKVAASSKTQTATATSTAISKSKGKDSGKSKVAATKPKGATDKSVPAAGKDKKPAATKSGQLANAKAKGDNKKAAPAPKAMAAKLLPKKAGKGKEPVPSASGKKAAPKPAGK